MGYGGEEAMRAQPPVGLERSLGVLKGRLARGNQQEGLWDGYKGARDRLVAREGSSRPGQSRMRLTIHVENAILDTGE